MNRNNDINDTLNRRINNVNVDKDIYNNVYVDVAERIQEALDKPKAIGKILSEKLDAPQNLKLYIKLAYTYPTETLFECVALTDEASRENLIKTTRAQYFYGIVRHKRRK